MNNILTWEDNNIATSLLIILQRFIDINNTLLQQGVNLKWLDNTLPLHGGQPSQLKAIVNIKGANRKRQMQPIDTLQKGNKHYTSYHKNDRGESFHWLKLLPLDIETWTGYPFLNRWHNHFETTYSTSITILEKRKYWELIHKIDGINEQLRSCDEKCIHKSLLLVLHKGLRDKYESINHILLQQEISNYLQLCDIFC